ncbi:MAG: energy transducer TonB [Deltaproteobacteria bacterium]|nr:energy transducer TonB [Deltaproteobacteria bacterium]
MKLASFIVLSAALHCVVLLQPLLFSGLAREQLLPATIISLEDEGGAAGKRPTLGNKARSAPSRAKASEISSERQVSPPLSNVVDKIAVPDNSVTVSEGLSRALSTESMSYGVDIFGVGDGGGFGRVSTGTGNSEAGSGTGTGRGIRNGDDQYRQAHTSDAPKPRYPESARRDGKEGRVLLRVLVNEEGRSASVEVNRSSGIEALDQAAVEAIKRWRFSPARLGDRPVESWVRIPIDFRLTDARD